MINNKKIEDIAEKSFENKFTDCGEMVDEGDIKEAIALGIKLGINEFLRDLWHPIEEKPQKEKVFLYQSSCYGFGLNQIADTKDWNYTIKYQKAIQWLYIDDLLPKEGDE